MNLLKFFIAVLLLVLSSQSSALFMPADYQLDSETGAASNDVGC